MKLRAGRLDTVITFQHRAATTEQTYGTNIYTWANLPTDAEEWAEVLDLLPSRTESLPDGVSLARRPVRIRTRYRDDITGEMRVKIGDRVLRIVAGPAVLGRREGLEMFCEELTTEGQEP
jgi:SPP1 family predicted phage head-tail adaptor